MRRRLEPAADRVQGKEKYAVEHGFENAFEEPRRYNDFSAKGNTATLRLSPGRPPNLRGVRLMRGKPWKGNGRALSRSSPRRR